MPSPLSLTQRFHNIEDEFHTAAATGGEALDSFYRNWSTLATDYLKAVDQSTVSDLEIQVAESVSSRIAIVSAGMIDVERYRAMM